MAKCEIENVPAERNGTTEKKRAVNDGEERNK